MRASWSTLLSGTSREYPPSQTTSVMVWQFRWTSAKAERTYLSSVEQGRRNISLVNRQVLPTALHEDIAAFFRESR